VKFFFNWLVNDSGSPFHSPPVTGVKSVEGVTPENEIGIGTEGIQVKNKGWERQEESVQKKVH
jgi:hypothetical protein